MRGLAAGKEGLARSSSIGGSRRQIEAVMSPPRRPEGDAPPMYGKSPKLAQACLRNILICWCKSSKVCTFFVSISFKQHKRNLGSVGFAWGFG